MLTVGGGYGYQLDVKGHREATGDLGVSDFGL